MLEYKVNAKPCASKKHTFMVSAWKVNATSEVATSFVCQNCLMTVDKAELETVNQTFVAEIQKTLDKTPTE